MAHEQINARLGNTHYQSAVATAITAGVFALVISVLLAIHLHHYNVSDPLASAELDKLKEQAKLYPADQTLSQQVTQLDTQLRRDQLARQQFLQRGTLLLVGTLAICFAAVIYARGHNSNTSLAIGKIDIKAEQVRAARAARTALTCMLVLISSGALFWSMYSPHTAEINQPESASNESTAQVDVSFASMDELQVQWPSFRGPGGLGIYQQSDAPTEWDKDKNILWQSPIPLPGNSSPVVWKDKVFLTGANESSQQVFCFDARTGKLLWSKDVKIPDHPALEDMNIGEDTGFAASTPVTDGRRLCAIFAGGDLGCFTVDGQLLWQKHLGVPDSMYGYASSLTAFENLVIVQWDVGSDESQSKLIAFSWQTGETVWQTPRPVPNSWSSPTVAKSGDKYMVFTAASPYVIAYEPATGKEIFRAECIQGDIAATPIIADDKLITMEPYQKLVAIDTANASGDVTASEILWQTEAAMPDICSPVSDGTFIWTLTSNGELGCYKLSDGSEVYTQNLELMFQASPVLAAGKLYLLADDGTMVIAEAAGQYKEIRRNNISDKCHASPAFAAGRIYIRGEHNLYCIGTAK